MTLVSVLPLSSNETFTLMLGSDSLHWADNGQLFELLVKLEGPEQKQIDGVFGEPPYTSIMG